MSRERALLIGAARLNAFSYPSPDGWGWGLVGGLVGGLGGGWAGVKDGLNIRAALNSFTEHIFCIVLTELYFCFDFFFSNKVQASNGLVCGLILYRGFNHRINVLLSHLSYISVLWPRWVGAVWFKCAAQKGKITFSSCRTGTIHFQKP